MKKGVRARDLTKKAGIFFCALMKIGLLFTYFRIAYHEWLYKVHLSVRKAHDNTYSNIKWYKNWTDKSYSNAVHRAVFLSFILSFAVFSVFQTMLPFWNKPKKALADSHTIKWQTQDDFVNNAVTTGTPTSISSLTTDSGIKLGNTDVMWGSAVSATGAPDGRNRSSSVWTGETGNANTANRMIIWGGMGAGGTTLNSGFLYNPANDSWTRISDVGAPSPRFFNATAWVNNKMVIWGGNHGSGSLGDGGVYDPASDTWTTINATGAPTARYWMATVSTGSKMIVWGGAGGGTTGAIYDQATDSWSAISNLMAPTGAYNSTAVWTGSRMIVWGGNIGGGTTQEGGSYDPVMDTWASTSFVDAPSNRQYHSAVWTGSEMIIWGGETSTAQLLNTGGIYNPGNNTWRPTSMTNAPYSRVGQTAVWTGSKMIVWGGSRYYASYLASGGIYNPASNSWSTLGGSPEPSGRAYHSAVWTGSKMIVWGGENMVSSYLNDGGATLVPGHYASGSIAGIKAHPGDGVKVNWASVSWTADVPLNTNIKARFRAADTENGLSGAVWGDYNNISGSGIVCSACASAEWLEAEFVLEGDGTVTPTLNDFSITYDSLNLPTLSKQYADNGTTEILAGSWFDRSSSEFIMPVSEVTCLADAICHAEYEVKNTNLAFDGTGLLSGSNQGASMTGKSWIVDSDNPHPDQLAAGSYKWRSRVIDNAGRVSGWSEYGAGGVAFRVEHSLPTGSFTIENGAKFTKGPIVHLNITAQDNESGVAKMRFSEDDVNWGEWQNYSELANYTFGGGTGEKNIYTQFKDNAGNVSGSKWRSFAGDFQNNASTTGQVTTKNDIAFNNNGSFNIVKKSYFPVDSLGKSAESYYHSLTIQGGNVWASGGNNYGQLGNGTTNDSSVPVKVLGEGGVGYLSDVVSVSSGRYASFALKSDGTVWAWGTNTEGILGDDPNIDQLVTTPIRVYGLDNVISISAGERHALALKSDGTVWAWGTNAEGQLGNGVSGPYTYSTLPSQVLDQTGFLTNVTSISAGSYHSLAIRDDGNGTKTVWAWGDNWNGQLGNNLGNSGYKAVKVMGPGGVGDLSNIVSIASGRRHCLAIDSSGLVWAWGSSNSGELGVDGITTSQPLPIQVVGLSGITKIAAGNYHSHALKNDGSVWSWGRNSHGQIGDGSNTNEHPVPYRTLNMSNITDITSTTDAFYALRSDKTVWATGQNVSGRFGASDVVVNSIVSTPVQGYAYVNDAGILGGDGAAIGLRFDAGSKKKWSKIVPTGTNLTGLIKFAVRVSDDGVNWSQLLGSDGQPVNWDVNGITSDSNLSAIPASRYVDVTVRLTKGEVVNPTVLAIALEGASYSTIIIDSTGPTISFDPNNKYPSENWNVKENVNSVEFRFTTNKATIAYVNYGKDTPNTEAHGETTYGTSHHIIVKNLGSKTPYKYRIRAFDMLGNETVYPSDSEDTSQAYTTGTTATDTGFDGLPQVSSLSQVEITASTAKITWKTKIPTSSFIDFGTTAEYGEASGDATLTTYHVVELKNLTAGLTYHYRVRGNDVAGNEFASGDYTFKAVMKPEISNIKVKEVSPYEATITWDTNVSTDSAINYGNALPYGNREYSDEKVNNHQIKIKKLDDKTTYFFQVEARDDYGNITKSENQNFATPLDTEGPKIEDIKIDIVPIESDQTSAQVIVSWKTSKPSTAKIEYDEGLIGGKYSKATIEDTSLNISHTSIIKDLVPNTTYHFRVVSIDKRGNETKSIDYNVVTPAKQKSIWQLIVKAIEETFSWTKNMGQFFNGIRQKATK
jgi:alpha-tubulin suppressor-like RCC1 family protein